jgi:BirA family transcriptional regulator, biotin operon repressor / biotin---[acetyl-CoA-carboxylase] ligase
MPIGQPLIQLAITSSTMDEATRLASEGAPEGLVVLADEQTAGRGRAGRIWAGPRGTAVLMSVVLRPPLRPDRLSTLPLVAGVAVAEAIETFAPTTCQLKWPNDVLIEGRKVAGVLLSARTSAGSVDHAILGVGINVTTPAAALPDGATSILAATGAPLDRRALAESLFDRIGANYDAFVRFDGRPDLATWRRRAVYLGRLVRLQDGESVVYGRLVDVDDDGAVLLDVGGARRRIVAGDLTRGPTPLNESAPRRP